VRVEVANVVRMPSKIVIFELVDMLEVVPVDERVLMLEVVVVILLVGKTNGNLVVDVDTELVEVFELEVLLLTIFVVEVEELVVRVALEVVNMLLTAVVAGEARLVTELVDLVDD
jgi:hypothetical protein